MERTLMAAAATGWTRLDAKSADSLPTVALTLGQLAGIAAG